MPCRWLSNCAMLCASQTVIQSAPMRVVRGGDMHEATRKLLGVLLRELDGFDRTKRSVVIGATNRKADLDPALLSRFDTVVDFPLPDNRCRCGV